MGQGKETEVSCLVGVQGALKGSPYMRGSSGQGGTANCQVQYEAPCIWISFGTHLQKCSSCAAVNLDQHPDGKLFFFIDAPLSRCAWHSLSASPFPAAS